MVRTVSNGLILSRKLFDEIGVSFSKLVLHFLRVISVQLLIFFSIRNITSVVK
jgi:hypothetical protein